MIKNTTWHPGHMVHKAEDDALYSCPRCGSGHVDLVENNTVLICYDCGNEQHYQYGDEDDAL